MEKIETTPEIRQLRSTLNELENNMGSVLKSNFWRKTTIDEKLLYLKEVSMIRARLWEEVYKTYPQLKGESTLGITEFYIKKL